MKPHIHICLFVAPNESIESPNSTLHKQTAEGGAEFASHCRRDKSYGCGVIALPVITPASLLTWMCSRIPQPTKTVG